MVTFNNRLMIDELTAEVNRSACVVICCQPTNYTVGLTTVVEALALGIPIICSRNPQMPMDIEDEGCGLLIDYGDVEGWERAIRFIAENPEEAKRMGERGRKLAEKVYNIRQCTREMAAVMKKMKGKNNCNKE